MFQSGCWKRRRGGRSQSPEEEGGGALTLRGVGQQLWWGPAVHGALGVYSKDGGVKLGGGCREPGTGAAHKAQRTRAEGEVATCSEGLAEEGKALLEVTTHLLCARPCAKHLT